MKRIIIAAPKSNAGKTTVTLGILRLLKRKNIKVRPFKSGPDYIDPKFHELACGHRGVNLDLFMMSEEDINASLNDFGGEATINCIEGVMGLFDGARKAEGSTAELAKKIKAPVVLVVDAKAVAYSVAPLIQGFKNFDPEVEIAGVIFNKVGSERHYGFLKEACDDIQVKSFGYLRKIPNAEIPSRHLGLSIADIEQYSEGIDLIADEIELNVEWQALLEIGEAHKFKVPPKTTISRTITIAVAQDAAFNFIYPQTLAAMEKIGDVVFFSPLKDEKIPTADFVYFPGGYPECYLDELSQNIGMLESIRNYAKRDGKIFAECGGMMYLGKSIIAKDGKTFDMVGHFDFSTSMEAAKLNLGYRTVVFGTNVFKGHEFHYSNLMHEELENNVGTVKNARQIEVKTKLYQKQKTIASYIHLFIGSEKKLNELLQVLN